MYIKIYIIVSVIISAFAVYDYYKEMTKKNLWYCLAVWVLFGIIWPFVLGHAIRNAWRKRTIK